MKLTDMRAQTKQRFDKGEKRENRHMTDEMYEYRSILMSILLDAARHLQLPWWQAGHSLLNIHLDYIFF